MMHMIVLSLSWLITAKAFETQRVFSGEAPSFAASLFPTVSNLSEIDITTSSQFSDLTTFAHLDHKDCFDDSISESKFDIAFVGAPFDTAVSARPGARFGPQGIRQGSQRILPNAYYDVSTGNNPFEDWAQIIDCGNVPMTVFDNRYALRQLEKAHRVISSQPSAANEKTAPRIITLGGDHTVTLAALRSSYDTWGEMSVIHFDSHIDTWDPKVLGGGISNYSAVNHGTFLHIAHEEHLISNQSIHAGIRAPVSRPKDDRRNDLRCGFDMITAHFIDVIGVKGIVDRIKKHVQDDPVYISVDIDVLDPAFAPATGTPEAGGWSTRELLSILKGLSGLNVVGADVVEVAPVYDTMGETTALAAADIAVSLLSLMVERNATSREGTTHKAKLA